MLLIGVVNASHFSVSDVVVIVGAVIFGAVAWRSKRGDFYKAVAQEKTDENDRLKAERDRLAEMTDITPIVRALEHVTHALERHAEILDQTLAKVRDMNGSLRAHSTAMQALADRLILDESARALLETAAERRPS